MMKKVYKNEEVQLSDVGWLGSVCLTFTKKIAHTFLR